MKEIIQKKITELSELINSINEEDKTISSETIERGNIVDLANKFEDTINHKPYIKTGFTQIDNIIHGFLPGELSVIGARPAMGKTSLLLDIALNISHNKGQNKAVLFINLENSLKQLTSRILENNIKSNDDVSDFNLHLICMHGDITTIINEMKTYVENESVEVVFIDYIQLVSLMNNKRYRDLELTVIIRLLKQFAIQNNIAIIVSSQLNRSVEYRGGDKKPQLSDLRDSGSLEQESDKVIFIHRPEYYGLTVDWEGNDTRGIAEIIIAKNRNGETGIATICYLENASTFISCKRNSSDFGDINTDLIYN